jgi:hypothetical protein
MADRNTRAHAAVAFYPNRAHEAYHERVSLGQLARRIAALQGLPYYGECSPEQAAGEPLYLVPSGTLIGVDEARRLGVAGEADLFGGVVPLPFVATKAISHGLISAAARAPHGWCGTFCAQAGDALLDGFTAYSLADAREGGLRLLERGRLRVKPVRATAGRGQLVVEDAGALEGALEAQDLGEIAGFGLVLEQHLEEVLTYSVGQVRIGAHLASYHGSQRLTEDNAGEKVYGGSDLVVVRGGFEALLQLDLPDPVRLAVSQSQRYDAVAKACFPALLASRRNYDVAQGRDTGGRQRSGVLEQSWRIGGASSAEIAALETFHADPTVSCVRASSLEFFGEQRQPPAKASVLFRGVDPEVGFMTKCVTVEAYEGA